MSGTTLFARHYEVPLTRCYLVIDHAESLESKIEWGCPTLEDAEYRDSTLWLSGGVDISIRVADIDTRVFVSGEEAGRLYRKVARGWPAESDRWLHPLG